MEFLVGLGNHFESEAVAGSLPVGQNSPKNVAHGLFAEQLTGSAFTAPRGENLRTWLYRIQPSVTHEAFCLIDQKHIVPSPGFRASPNQMRWNPIAYPTSSVDFVSSLQTWVENGDMSFRRGNTIYLYAATRSMDSEFFYSADGELLIVPQEGSLRIDTEMGRLQFGPGEIGVVPRGIRFQVFLSESKARGYVCENHGVPLRLPGLGPIGANGLANPRDFCAPKARYEERRGKFELVTKFQGNLWKAALDHSPLDVVAWHGNYYPYQYDLSLFNTMNSVSFDHPDPSIFTVLTSPSEVPGTSNLDFVIFPPRWMVAEHTFRPPYYHRNAMSEFMGLISGTYDAKATGFVPGGSSLHNCMSAHGPDADTYYSALKSSDEPKRYENTLAFMFESCIPFRTSAVAETSPSLQKNYLDCWKGLKPAPKFLSSAPAAPR